MLDAVDIARWRLRTQRLVPPHATSAEDAVAGLLAVQAENPGQAAWAVAARTARPHQGDLARLLDDGTVLRTHVLRPTWHFVHADDIAWLVDLTGPRVRRVTSQQLATAHGMDGPALERAVDIVVEVLSGSGDLTRPELARQVHDRGVPTDGQALMLLLAHAELLGLVCSGPPADGEHTYAPMARRVPNPRRLDRAEALAELALRYFSGHGPGTEQDLAYWATLPVTDVRTGLEQVRHRLASFEHDGRRFWHAPGDPPAGPQEPAGHLLQILDEMYRGYQDSRWVLDAAGQVPRGREAAIGMALVDGQLLASMRRTVGREQVTFDLRPYRPLTAAEREALDEAAQRYGAFLGLPARLSLP